MLVCVCVLVGYNKEQHVFLINFKYMTILLKRDVLVALNGVIEIIVMSLYYRIQV